MPSDERTTERVMPDLIRRRIRYEGPEVITGKIRQEVEGQEKEAEEGPPPNYHMAFGQLERCASCRHFGGAGGWCEKFEQAVDPNFACDEWEGDQLNLPDIPSFNTIDFSNQDSSGNDDIFKFSIAAKRAFDMTGTGLGQTSGVGSPVSTSVLNVTKPMANPAQQVATPAAKPLVSPGHGPKTPPLVKVQGPQQQWVPSYVKAARLAEAILLKQSNQPATAQQPAQQQPQQPAQQQPQQPAQQQAQPGQFKPSPVFQVPGSTNSLLGKWLQSVQQRFVPQAPPPQPAQNVAQGQQQNTSQQLQKTARREKDEGEIPALLSSGMPPFVKNVLQSALTSGKKSGKTPKGLIIIRERMTIIRRPRSKKDSPQTKSAGKKEKEDRKRKRNPFLYGLGGLGAIVGGSAGSDLASGLYVDKVMNDPSVHLYGDRAEVNRLKDLMGVDVPINTPYAGDPFYHVGDESVTLPLREPWGKVEPFRLASTGALVAPPPPKHSLGVAGHELGHAKTMKGSKLLVPRALAYQAAPWATGIGSIGAALDRRGRDRWWALGGSLGALPRLVEEVIASHHGGMGMLDLKNPQGMSDSAKTYLSSYAGIPTYLIPVLMPWLVMGLSRAILRKKKKKKEQTEDGRAVGDQNSQGSGAE